MQHNNQSLNLLYKIKARKKKNKIYKITSITRKPPEVRQEPLPKPQYQQKHSQELYKNQKHETDNS